jgi:hypothetical protein
VGVPAEILATAAGEDSTQDNPEALWDSKCAPCTLMVFHYWAYVNWSK